MACKKNRQEAAAALRDRAEGSLRENAGRLPKEAAALTPADMQKALHELTVYQIELELQNEELRRSQAELEDSRKRYFDLYDRAPAGYITLCEKGLIREANLSAAKLLGMARGELSGQPITRFILQADRDLYYLYRKQLSESEESRSCELRMTKKDGAAFWSRLVATADAEILDGAAVCRITLSDITALKRAEESLRVSEERLRFATQAAKIGTFEWDVQTGVNVWSPELEAMYGLVPGEFGKTQPSWENLVHAEDRAAAVSLVNQTFENGEPVEGEWRVVWRDGSVHWIAGRFQAYKDAAGKPLRLCGVNMEVTERKQAEATLRASEERFRLFMDNSPTIAWIKNEQGRHVYFSKTFLDRFGVRLEDWRGKTDAELWPAETAEVFRKSDLAVLSADHPVEGVDELIDFDGSRSHWLTCKFPYRDEAGDRFVAGIGLDITERKHAEEEVGRLNAELEQRVQARTAELSATNRELEAFCYSVSHDLRAPLRSMDGFSQALLEDYGTRLNETGKDYLRRVRANSQRMSRLIDDLLNLSRIKQAHMRLTAVDLTSLAEAAIAELRKAEPSRAVDVRIAPGLTARGDPVLLGTVMANLLENAWKFTGRRPDAVIEVGAEAGDRKSEVGSRKSEAGESLTSVSAPRSEIRSPISDLSPASSPVFFVRDNGAGFDPKYADKLFMPFQRLHSMKDFPGTGIGLATVQRVIHRHGGLVWYESAPGKGATFYFTVGANA